MYMNGLGISWDDVLNPFNIFGPSKTALTQSQADDIITSAPKRVPTQISLTPTQVYNVASIPMPRLKPPVPASYGVTQPTAYAAASVPVAQVPTLARASAPQAPPSSGSGTWAGLTNILQGGLALATAIFSSPGASPNAGLPYNMGTQATPPGPGNQVSNLPPAHFTMPSGMLPIALGIGGVILVASLLGGGGGGGNVSYTPRRRKR